MGRTKMYSRNEVLETAMNLFWKKGYDGTHLQELVSSTGLNRFSLYKEFDGKEGIFSEALDKYLLDAKSYYAPLMKAPHCLSNIYDYFGSIHFSKGFHGCFAVNTLTEQHIISSHEFKKVKVFFKLVERSYYDNLKAAQSSGDLPKNKDLKSISKLLISLDLGLSIYGIVNSKNSDKKLIVSLLPAFLE